METGGRKPSETYVLILANRGRADGLFVCLSVFVFNLLLLNHLKLKISLMQEMAYLGVANPATLHHKDWCLLFCAHIINSLCGTAYTKLKMWRKQGFLAFNYTFLFYLLKSNFCQPCSNYHFCIWGFNIIFGRCALLKE